jgi:hypothetical protein
VTIERYPVAGTGTVATRTGEFNVLDHGAVGDGTVDDTAALQAVLDSVDDGDVIYLPKGTYRLTAALTCTKSVTIKGAGVFPAFRSVTSGGAFDWPSAAPWVRGSVLLQSAAGADALVLSGSGKQVNLEGFGIRFADAIRHVDTGHGVVASPAQVHDEGGHDHGLLNSTWRNVVVFGHDGDHYAFWARNQMQCRWDHLQSYGGGGFYLDSDSHIGNYGNLVATDTTAMLYVGGTAHGFDLRGRTSDSWGVLNLMAFIRPQCNIEHDDDGTFPEIAAAPTNTQYLWTSNHNIDHLTLIAPDFEGWAVASPVDLAVNGKVFIDPSGIYGGSSGMLPDFPPAIRPMSVGTKYMSASLRMAGAYNAAPSLAAGANAGTAPPAPPVTSSNSDERGVITFGTGSSPAAGELVRANWTAYRGGEPTRVMATPNNAATAALGLYVTHDGGGFSICSANAPAGSQPDTAFSVEYVVVC